MDHLPSPGAAPSPRPDVLVRIEPFASAAAQWAVAQAEAELVIRYGYMADVEHTLSADRFDPPTGAFLVARRDSDGIPVGGVGLRPHLPAVGEVKRLWVDPDQRGGGVARALMEGLEDAARRLGFTALHLETGTLQPEAIAFYAATGWIRQSLDANTDPTAVGPVVFTKVLA